MYCKPKNYATFSSWPTFDLSIICDNIISTNSGNNIMIGGLINIVKSYKVEFIQILYLVEEPLKEHFLVLLSIPYLSKLGKVSSNSLISYTLMFEKFFNLFNTYKTRKMQHRIYFCSIRLTFNYNKLQYL
jgi:hypothetical protein